MSENRFINKSKPGLNASPNAIVSFVEKAKAIKVTNRPTNGVEMASLIDELTETKIGADGKAIVPEGSKHIRARTDADGEAGTEQSLNSENEMDENPSESQLSEEEKIKAKGRLGNSNLRRTRRRPALLPLCYANWS